MRKLSVKDTVVVKVLFHGLSIDVFPRQLRCLKILNFLIVTVQKSPRTANMQRYHVSYIFNWIPVRSPVTNAVLRSLSYFSVRETITLINKRIMLMCLQEYLVHRYQKIDVQKCEN